MFLKNTWSPMQGFVFLIVKLGNQNRSYLREWLNMFKWLAFSDLRKGDFCIHCVLFQPSGGSPGCQVIIIIFNNYITILYE
jgi:hypothetical protein